MTECYVCNTPLVPDHGAPDDPVTYQFENALWIGFRGGYGMFVDNLEANLPINTEDRWLRGRDGDYLTFVEENGRIHPIPDPHWKPEYREERILPDRPDYEAVLCHDCAHALCEAVPWIERLLNPHNSHTHRQDYKNAHPGHFGWDYTGPKGESWTPNTQ